MQKKWQEDSAKDKFVCEIKYSEFQENFYQELADKYRKRKIELLRKQTKTTIEECVIKKSKSSITITKINNLNS